MGAVVRAAVPTGHSGLVVDGVGNRRRIGKRAWGVLASDAHDAKRYSQAPVPSAWRCVAGQAPPDAVLAAVA